MTFSITAPAHPHATGVAVYPALLPSKTNLEQPESVDSKQSIFLNYTMRTGEERFCNFFPKTDAIYPLTEIILICRICYSYTSNKSGSGYMTDRDTFL